MQALTSDGVADLSDQRLVKELRGKHPAELAVGRRGAGQPFEPFTEKEVKKWGERLKRSSSADSIR